MVLVKNIAICDSKAIFMCKILTSPFYTCHFTSWGGRFSIHPTIPGNPNPVHRGTSCEVLGHWKLKATKVWRKSAKSAQFSRIEKEERMGWRIQKENIPLRSWNGIPLRSCEIPIRSCEGCYKINSEIGATFFVAAFTGTFLAQKMWSKELYVVVFNANLVTFQTVHPYQKAFKKSCKTKKKSETSTSPTGYPLKTGTLGCRNRSSFRWKIFQLGSVSLKRCGIALGATGADTARSCAGRWFPTEWNLLGHE